MNQTALNNRVYLAKLVFSMRTFTEAQLIDKYTEERSNFYFGGTFNIADYLKDLSQFGTLRYENNKYTVAGVGEIKYA